MAYYNVPSYEAQANQVQRYRTVDIDGRSQERSREPSGARSSLDAVAEGGGASPGWSSDNRAGARVPTAGRRSSVASSGEERGSSDERVRCYRCGGEDFKGRRRNGKHVLICGRCGVVAH